jgi:hypothetical protein
MAITLGFKADYEWVVPINTTTTPLEGYGLSPPYLNETKTTPLPLTASKKKAARQPQ